MSNTRDFVPQTHVLLVEDTSDDAMLVQVHLRRAGQFTVSHVETMEAACGTLAARITNPSEPIDLVVLDLNLPDSFGLGTFRHLHQLFPEIPIVILSGNEDEKLAMAAVGEGAQDYVSKDKADAEVLVRSLRYATERQRRQSAERRNLLIEREMAFAAEIQQYLLPRRPPQVIGFDIAGVCRPADACAGDFFDSIENSGREPSHGTGHPFAGKIPGSESDGRNGEANGSLSTGGSGEMLDILVADVSGHGLGPALIVAATRRMLRTCARMYDNIGQCITLVNQAVSEDSLPEQFVTMFYARIDQSKRTLSWCAAGHPGWVIDANGCMKPLEYSGMPLGLAPDAEYKIDGTVNLKPGDLVLLMTDGAWEAQTRDGEQFGQQRVIDFVHQNRDLGSAVILERLLRRIDQFCQPARPHDDITVVLMKVLS